MKLLVKIKKKLRDFTLAADFETGREALAILGSSGCGKSMTLKCIAGIEQPDEGHIELNGRVLYDSEQGISLPIQQRRVGYLFQDYALFPNMTVRQNLAIAVRDKAAGARIDSVLESFGLQELRDQYPGKMSGGQQQRTALARILISDPDVLLLDEPFAAMDHYIKWQLEKELITLLEKYQKPTLFVSHNRKEVYRICRRAAVIHGGKMGRIKTREELFNQPRTYAEALLTGCRNLSPAEVLSDGCVRLTDWSLTIRPAADLPSGVRYGGIPSCGISLNADCQDHVKTICRGVIAESDRDILLLQPEGGARELVCEAEAGHRVTVGDQVGIRIEPQQILLLKEYE